MPSTNFQRPTLPELILRVQADVEGEVQGVSSRLRRTFEYAAARAWGGVAHGLHGHIAWAVRQIFPDTAGPAALQRWADLHLETPRVQPEAATGTVEATGSGGDLGAGDVKVINPTTGRVYSITAGATGITTATNITILADDVGSLGNVAPGATLQLASPIAGVDSDLKVNAGGIGGGGNLESLESQFDRLHENLKSPPRGGAVGDHVAWALTQAGVTRSWERTWRTHPGIVPVGEVHLFFVRDNDGTGAAIIPDSGERASVQAAVQALSPFLVTCPELTAVAFDFTASFTSKIAPSITESAIEAEVADLIVRDAEPGVTILRSRVDEAISVAQGEVSHELEYPDFDKAHTYAQMPIPGSLTVA